MTVTLSPVIDERSDLKITVIQLQKNYGKKKAMKVSSILVTNFYISPFLLFYNLKKILKQCPQWNNTSRPPDEADDGLDERPAAGRV